MKNKGLLYTALGSLIAVAFTTYIAPLLEIAYSDISNSYTLRSTKVQVTVNDINRKELEKQEKASAPLANAIGYAIPEEVEYYEEEE